jgi:hypothetical protein
MTWQQVGGVMDVGDVGGDWQIGPAPSVRFQHTEKPGSLMTVAIYPVMHSEGDTCVPRTCIPGSLDLQQQIEYMVCTDPEDPGGTEQWSDYEYEILADLDDTNLNLPDLGAANFEAVRLLASWVPGIITWDGESFR